MSVAGVSACGYEWRRIVGVGGFFESGATAMRFVGGCAGLDLSAFCMSCCLLVVGRYGGWFGGGFMRRRKRNRIMETATIRARK